MRPEDGRLLHGDLDVPGGEIRDPEPLAACSTCSSANFHAVETSSGRRLGVSIGRGESRRPRRTGRRPHGADAVPRRGRLIDDPELGAVVTEVPGPTAREHVHRYDEFRVPTSRSVGRWTRRYRARPDPNVLQDRPIRGRTLNLIVSGTCSRAGRSREPQLHGPNSGVVNKTNLVEGTASASRVDVVLVRRGRLEFTRPNGDPESRPLPGFRRVEIRDEHVEHAASVRGHGISAGHRPSRRARVFHPPGDMPLPRGARPDYLLATGDFRVQDAVWSRGVLWLGSMRHAPRASCPSVSDSSSRPNSITVRQDFRLSAPARNYSIRLLPSARRATSRFLAGYSSADEFPGSW